MLADLEIRNDGIFGVEINAASFVIGLCRVVLAGIDKPGMELGDALERPLHETERVVAYASGRLAYAEPQVAYAQRRSPEIQAPEPGNLRTTIGQPKPAPGPFPAGSGWSG